MAPTRQNKATEGDQDDLLTQVKSLVAKVDAMTAQLTASNTKITSLTTRLSTIESLLKEQQSKNVKLEEQLTVSSQENLKLKSQLNRLEQYGRSWSVRIIGCNIPSEDENNNHKVMQHIYRNLLVPILEGAVTKGLLTAVPPLAQLLETAHVLPAKLGGKKPIIARFFSRNMRAMIFMLKKEFGPKEQAPVESASAGGVRSRQKYAIYDDLTKANFTKMRTLANDPRVASVWSIKGQIKYKKSGENVIFNVKCPFITNDELLS